MSAGLDEALVGSAPATPGDRGAGPDAVRHAERRGGSLVQTKGNRVRWRPGEDADLDFNSGAELPDPFSSPSGSGKLLRRAKIATPEDLANSALRRPLEAASTHRMPANPPSRKE